MNVLKIVCYPLKRLENGRHLHTILAGSVMGEININIFNKIDIVFNNFL